MKNYILSVVLFFSRKNVKWNENGFKCLEILLMITDCKSKPVGIHGKNWRISKYAKIKDKNVLCVVFILFKVDDYKEQ